MSIDIKSIAQTFAGIIIPAKIRAILSDDDYFQLELLMFDRARYLNIPLSDDPDGRWGDQREDD